MATLQDIYAQSQPNGELAGRVEGAFIKASWAVLTEDAGTTDHANRLALARNVLESPRAYVQKFYRLVISNATIQANLGNTSALQDSEVENAVNGFWTTMANLEAS